MPPKVSVTQRSQGFHAVKDLNRECGSSSRKCSVAILQVTHLTSMRIFSEILTTMCLDNKNAFSERQMHALRWSPGMENSTAMHVQHALRSFLSWVAACLHNVMQEAEQQLVRHSLLLLNLPGRLTGALLHKTLHGVAHATQSTVLDLHITLLGRYDMAQCDQGGSCHVRACGLLEDGELICKSS